MHRFRIFLAVGLLLGAQESRADENTARVNALAVAEARLKSIYEKRDFAPAAVRYDRFARVGMPIPTLRVGVIDRKGGDTRWVKLPADPGTFYIQDVSWAGNSKELLIEMQSRSRDHRKFLLVNIETGEVATAYEETDPAWVDASYAANAGLEWVRDGKEFVLLSERDGWRQAYLIARDGEGNSLPGAKRRGIVEQVEDACASLASRGSSEGWRMSEPDQTLLAAHGLRAPLELEVLDTQSGAATRHPLARPWAVLGRSRSSSIALADPAISHRHLYLQVLSGKLFGVDLASRTGATLDGTSFVSGWVEPDQTLGLGRFRVKVVGPLPEATLPSWNDPLEDRLTSLPDGSVWGFDVAHEGASVAQWRMNRPLALVGTSARCRVRLNDDTISRIHCSLVATAQGVWIIDLLSRRGISVGGQTVPFALLREDDAIKIGSYTLRPQARRPRSGLPAARQAENPAPAAPTPMVVFNTGNDGMMVPFGVGNGSATSDEQQLVLPLVQQFSALQQHMFDQFNQTMVMMVQMLSAMQQEQVALIRDEMKQFQKATDELTNLRQQLDANKTARPASTPAPHTTSRWAAGTWPGAQSAETPADAHPALPAPAAAKAEEKEDEAVHVWLHERIEELQTQRQNSWQRIMDFIRGA